MEFHPSLDAPRAVSFAGDTLILPVVSHGNVGQLATDLLVASVTGARRVGCLDHPALLPCAGRDAFASDEGDGPGGGHIALGMEVYRVGGGGGGALCLAQQRAEVTLGWQRSFAADVAAWIAERGFAEVVVLASAPSTEAKAPGEIGGTSFQHVTASNVPDDRCVAAGIAHRKTSGGGGGGGATADQKTRDDDDQDDRALPPWSLMRALRAANVTAVALIATCSEGDNTEDAAAMADAVAGVLGLGVERGGVEMRRAPTDEKVTNDGSESRIRWTIPPSWRAAYGQQPMASELFA